MGGIRNNGTWIDNAEGLDMDVQVFGQPNIGSAGSKLGTIYAVSVVADGVVGDTTLAYNNYLSSINAAGTGTNDLIKSGAGDATFLNTPGSTSGNLTVAGTSVGTWNTTALTYPKFNLTDGSDKNYSLNTIGAGTAYALTATSAAVDLGTTDPVVTLNKAGTYLLIGRANLQYAGATFAANRTVTLKLRRTNNTAADVTGATTALGTNVTTTVTGTLGTVVIPAVLYTTANTDDAITIFGDVSVIPTAGALNVTEASIMAIRLY